MSYSQVLDGTPVGATGAKCRFDVSAHEACPFGTGASHAFSEQDPTDIRLWECESTIESRLQWSRWLWVCQLLGVVAATAMLLVWGFTLWTATGVALLLVCPAIVTWALLYSSRDEARDRLLQEYRRRQKS